MTRSLALALVLSLGSLGMGGCSKPPPAPAAAPAIAMQASARAFVDELLAALEHEDLPAWKQLLSARMRDRLASDDLAQNQLSAWRRDVLPLAHTLRAADVAVVDHTLMYTPDGSAPIALAQVAAEPGGLRLDDN